MILRLLLKKDIVLIVISKVTNGVSTLALNLYAVHYLSPAEFGAVTLCTTLLMLLDGMLGAALDLTVVKLQPLERLTADGSPIERSALSMKFVGCVSFGTAIVLMAPMLGMFLLHRADVRPLFLAWSVAATAVMTLRSTQLGLQLREHYVAFAGVEFLNTSLRVVLVLWMLQHGHRSATAFVGAFAIGSSVALVVGLVTLMRMTGLRRWWGFEQARLVLEKARHALLTYGLSALVSRADILVLAIVGTPAQLGLYGSAMTLASVPEIASTYLAPAFLPRIVPYCRSGVFKRFFRVFHSLLFAVMLAAYLGMLWLIPRFGVHLLSGKYAPAVAVTLVLLPGTLATASIFPISLNLLMLRGSKIFIYFDLLMLPLLLTGYVLGARRGIMDVAVVTSMFRIAKTVIVQEKATRAAGKAQDEWMAETAAAPAGV